MKVVSNNQPLIDVILYVESFSALVQHLMENHPDLLAQSEGGQFVDPPVVTGFTRTPAVVNGDKVLVYGRLRKDEADKWRSIPGVEILSEVAYDGKGTVDDVYDALFADSEAKAKYDSVYVREYTYTDEDGNEQTGQKAERFGAIA